MLLLSYFAGLWFSLKTHRDVFNPDRGDEEAPDGVPGLAGATGSAPGGPLS
mgnify:CR=1 FL=1